MLETAKNAGKVRELCQSEKVGTTSMIFADNKDGTSKVKIQRCVIMEK